MAWLRRSGALPVLVGTGMLLVGAMLAAADQFEFLHLPDDRYRLVTRVDENVYRNGVFLQRVDILNKIAVHVAEVREDGAGLLESSFLSTERAFDSNVTYGPVDQLHESVFWRKPRGDLEIQPHFLMPIVRGVPTFPEGEVQPGDTWVGDGEEVHDFSRNFGVTEPFRFPIRVNYSYLGKDEIDGREVGVLAIDYTVFHRARPVVGQSFDVPERLTGLSEQLYYWDFDLGRATAYSESFEFIIHLASGEYFEFSGTASGELVQSAPLDREQAAAEIRSELEAEGVTDVTVEAVAEGVTLTLDNIQFPPDSPLLIPAEQDKIRRIAEILDAFRERDILITGHTARVGTEESSQILSEQRAQAVGDFLLGIDSRAADQMVFRGLGSRRPVGDNGNEAGRRSNRRVEITILEN
jgi:outer membrane protein OmpA-like peptidoglycan-associated protein